jgi:nucleoside-diphosphate-sugar epimerase
LVLVTGANGFVGQALVHYLASQKLAPCVVAAVRRDDLSWPEGIKPILMGDLQAFTDWQNALQDVNEVVHLAGLAHSKETTNKSQHAEYFRINVDCTSNLALQAAKSGVKRFVYLSSIKVNGESTIPGNPFTAQDIPSPEDIYGVSKFHAELALKQIALDTGMEVVIIRPPLIYGPAVKANFNTLMCLLSKRIPLPLAGITNNRRSFVALGNLNDLILKCLSHPQAANHTFLVSDGEDLSTAELITRLGIALNRPAHLFDVSEKILEWGASLTNTGGVFKRLCGSLQIDMRTTQKLLDWHPPLTVDRGLKLTAESFHI